MLVPAGLQEEQSADQGAGGAGDGYDEGGGYSSTCCKLGVNLIKPSWYKHFFISDTRMNSLGCSINIRILGT